MPIFVQPKMPCDVCRLLDEDSTPKDVAYCRLCDSWICQDDLNNWLRRARAAIKRKLEPTFKGDPNYKTGSEEIDKQVGL